MASERTLRPKEKRKVSSLLLYDKDDEVMTSNKRGEPKDKKKHKSKKQKSKRYQEAPTNTDFDFGQIHDDSDEGEGILVIDDPDAFVQDEYNSDEERRKRTAQKQERENEQLRLEEGLKKKKKKRHANTAAKKFYMVPTDQRGVPIMPIEMRGLTIHSLGKIVFDRKKFHAKRYVSIISCCTYDY